MPFQTIWHYYLFFLLVMISIALWFSWFGQIELFQMHFLNQMVIGGLPYKGMPAIPYDYTSTFLPGLNINLMLDTLNLKDFFVINSIFYISVLFSVLNYQVAGEYKKGCYILFHTRTY